MLRLVASVFLFFCVTAEPQVDLGLLHQDPSKNLPPQKPSKDLPPQKGPDLPPYIVTFAGPDFEVRLLPAWTWLCAKSDSAGENQVISRRLSYSLRRYSGGQNQARKRFPATQPATSVLSDHAFTMCMAMPPEHQSDLPLPNQDNVFVDYRPSTTIAVRKFYGNPLDQSVWPGEAAKLKDSLDAAHLEGFVSYPFYRAFIDPPSIQPPRYEVWFQQESTEDQQLTNNLVH